MSKFCKNCGQELKDSIKYCPNCGATIENNEKTNNTTNQRKSKVAAGILGIFLGSLGVHNFYLGYTSKAVAQLLLTLLGWILCFTGPIVAGIWGFIEGILILAGSINTDADGNQLTD